MILFSLKRIHSVVYPQFFILTKDSLSCYSMLLYNFSYFWNLFPHFQETFTFWRNFKLLKGFWIQIPVSKIIPSGHPWNYANTETKHIQIEKKIPGNKLKSRTILSIPDFRFHCPNPGSLCQWMTITQINTKTDIALLNDYSKSLYN